MASILSLQTQLHLLCVSGRRPTCKPKSTEHSLLLDLRLSAAHREEGSTCMTGYTGRYLRPLQRRVVGCPWRHRSSLGAASSDGRLTSGFGRREAFQDMPAPEVWGSLACLGHPRLA